MTCSDPVRLELLARARLYVICDSAPGGRDPEPFLDAALEGGADIVQLRDKRASDDALLEVAAIFRRVCDEHGALFIFNDRPDLAVTADADGVHLGRGDGPISEARAIVGDRRLIGLSTHTASQVDATGDADYIGIGPVYETPTKPGRPAVGLELVGHAVRRALVPAFAIGGIEETNVADVLSTGASRIAVVRAIVDAPDPGGAARRLRAAIEQGAGVGAT
ncbi:MAG TPA: thiamine phosphate synthase, partial [Solirubrobacteraceae bacterium]|nr:thiamine phosphate synthase [Solirubrobacteraceae bacterium]